MYDPAQLATFLAVAQTRGFSDAGRQLGLRQSTVSQHIRKLEAQIGRRLFVRDTHSVTLTVDGNALKEFAQSIIELNERAERYFAGTELRGRIRFGTSEDFALSQLPEVLREFRRRHPAIDVELTVGLSGDLYRKLDARKLDLLLAKRQRGDNRGKVVWRDRLVWVGREDWQPDPDRPLPLVTFPPPSIGHTAAIEALDQVRRPWRIACLSGSLSGLRAAAMAGLGVVVQARNLIVEGLVELPRSAGLPELGDTEFVVISADKNPRSPAAALSATLIANGARFRSV
ncbi:LysR family transcriptional regulator [Hyphomicrobium sp. 99]|uniref:LysR family transcriptional regulator n=1 Tax=Hyphomicrobium sp. 99 TaxID=1163419 RepID=UPI0005F89496|nr:LysR substrate-binding domain-containing protein [Hyphomicrobium sp. 99]